MGGIYTIPFGYAFSDELARGLKRIGESDPLNLARAKIFLPNRRAIRSLSDAFVKVSANRPLLLPNMRPLGDIADEDILFLDEAEGGGDLPPAMPSIRRHILLAFLIQKKDPDISFIQAFRLAVSLAGFIDEMQIEGIPLRALKDVVADEFAQHWNDILAFLQIVTASWPEILLAENRLDPKDRRNKLLMLEAERLAEKSSATPVLVAGSTGSVPATAQLMKTVLGLPQGAIILPGFDHTLNGEDRALIAVDPSHPQYNMVKLLEKLEVPAEDVILWPGLPSLTNEQESRRLFIGHAMLPAASTDRWPDLAASHGAVLAQEGCRHIHRIDCRTEQEEAAVIALLLREKLEQEGATAALITADRKLAERVASELRFWSLDIDDSAGQPLATFPVGTFLIALAEMVASEFAPVPLLTLLKHPFSQLGGNPGQFRHMARQLELLALRGARPKAGLQGVAAILDEAKIKAAEKNQQARLEEVRLFWVQLSVLLAPLEGDSLGGNYIDEFLRVAQILAGDTLWQGQAGADAYRLMGDLKAQFDLLAGINRHDFSILLQDSLRSLSVRPVYGKHPRLFIWGPLEARLQHVDRAILGGLNEGSWPRDIQIDPWLNRQMRRDIDLPPLERRVGQAAHDFYQAMGNKEVFLTRAQRVEGTPAEPSRWLLRLEAYLKCFGSELPLDVAARYRQWVAAWDRPEEEKRIGRPMPRPTGKLLPAKLPVSRIGEWLTNPYVIFARYILKIRPLAALDEEPSAAERGTIIHEILYKYIQSANHGSDPDLEFEKLSAIADQCFARLANRPGLLAFWRPAFDKVARFFIAEFLARKGEIARSFCEIKGKLRMAVNDTFTFTLVAVADRIDQRKDGAYTIIDYKTGSPPSGKSIDEAKQPQLILEAAMLEKGAFPIEVPQGSQVHAVEYWGLKPSALNITIYDDKLKTLIEKTEDQLLELLAYYSSDQAGYRASDESVKSDYAHLSRIREWSLQGEES